jgi:hypothetical protein
MITPGQYVPGGPWHTSEPTNLEVVSGKQLHKLFTDLAESGDYLPGLVSDPRISRTRSSRNSIVPP